MVYIMELPYDEIVDILDVKSINGTTIGYVLPPGMDEITYMNSMLNFLLPDELKVIITIDDSRIATNLTFNKTINFTKILFFYHIRLYSILFWIVS